MGYLAKNHKNNIENKNNQNNYPRNTKKIYNNQGFQGNNNYKNRNNYGNTDTSNSIANKLREVKEKQKKVQARKAISKAVGAINPVAGAATDAALKTEKGEKLIDAYTSASSPAEGINNVRKEIKKDLNKKKFILLGISMAIPILLLIFFLSIIAKNSDSQIFSNENGGTVESESYKYDDKTINIYKNYPGLYEKVIDIVNRVGNEYQMDIDKYLIIATLVSPIENGLIVPVDDNSCGEAECYYFRKDPNSERESLTWEEFLSSWADQAELLSKMQFLTYINNENEIVVDCGEEQTMEQYAKNDLETNTFPWYGWFNPINWFKGFRDSAGAEVNARCVDARNGESKVPTVRVSSVGEGTNYITNNSNREYEYIKEPTNGGVYFWNLINKNGFIHEYLKDYLSDEASDDPDKNYEINKRTIVDTVNYIYSYYESIRKDCNNFPVMRGELETIDFQEDSSSPVYTLDFEDVFVGGAVLATYGGATGEVAKAQAVLSRSIAYNYIVEQGGSTIIGSAIMGCHWKEYNPTFGTASYDPEYPKKIHPEIYNAVKETRGIVITNYGDTSVLYTEYDAFCPVTREPQNGFYYLDDEQRNLPIEVSKAPNFGTMYSRAECPCFQNKGSRPSTEFAETLEILLKRPVGGPPQTTTSTCWTPTGETKNEVDDNGRVIRVLKGFAYETTGGHGRGVSQQAMAYFSQFGYDYRALIKLFLERDGQGISFKRYEGSILEDECNYYMPIN